MLSFVSLVFIVLYLCPLNTGAEFETRLAANKMSLARAVGPDTAAIKIYTASTMQGLGCARATAEPIVESMPNFNTMIRNDVRSFVQIFGNPAQSTAELLLDMWGDIHTNVPRRRQTTEDRGLQSRGRTTFF